MLEHMYVCTQKRSKVGDTTVLARKLETEGI